MDKSKAKSKALEITKKGYKGVLEITKKPPVPRKTKGTMYA